MPRCRTQPEAPGSLRPWCVGRCARGAGPCRVCSRPPGGTPARTRPLAPGGFAMWRTSPIKGRSDPARAHWSRRPPRVCHRVPLAPPPVNDPSAPSYDPVNSPTPRLDPVEAQTTPCCAAIPRASPERAPPRRPPPGATELACQHHPHLVSYLKPTRGEFMVTSPPFPWPPAPLARRILAGTTSPMARGPNCVSLFLSGVFYANQGHGCELQNLPGAWLKI
jgi:hypothetical protein